MSVAAVLSGAKSWWVENCDVRAGLAMLPDGCVQVVCCSPPYWSLRNYGCEPQVWGATAGDDCPFWVSPHPHTWGAKVAGDPKGGSGTFNGRNGRGEGYARSDPRGQFCSSCGAWRGELGSEPDPDLFVSHLIDVFREVRRVLAKDGCLFVVIGDSYAGSGKGPTGHNGIGDQSERQGFVGSVGARIGSQHGESGHTSGVTPPSCLKPKDLVMIPFRFALAMQADGWWVRGDMIWAKKSPMPESVTDRCTRSHEFIFHFTKSRRYYWDAKAVAEPQMSDHPSGNGFVRTARLSYDGRGQEEQWEPSDKGANLRDVWHLGPEPLRDMEHYAAYPSEIPRRCILAASRPGDVVLDPFSGSGTTVMTALRLGRRGIGFELNPKYVTDSIGRIESDAPLWNTEPSEPAPQPVARAGDLFAPLADPEGGIDD